MKNHHQEFVEKLRSTLHQVYTKILETGDATGFEKGIIKGMMIAARTLDICSVTELTELVNQEKMKVFGVQGAPQPTSQKDRQLEEDVWYADHGRVLDTKSLRDYLEIPTFIRNGKIPRKIKPSSPLDGDPG
ncbi:MAG: hypothetical protein H7838_04460 [Magnetococcus sp. DMHC-8]